MISLLTSITDFWWGNLFFLSMFSKIYKTQRGVGTVFEQVYCSRCPIWIPTLLSRFFLPWWPRSASWPHSSTILTRQSLARMEQQWFSKRYVCFHKYSIEIEIEGWVKRKIGKHAVNMTLMRLFFPSVCRLFICWCWTSRRVSSSAPYKHDYTNGSISSWTMCYHVSTGVLSYKYSELVLFLKHFCLSFTSW